MEGASNAVAIAEPQPRAAKVPLVAGNSPRAIVPTDFEGAWRISQAVVAARMAPRSLETVEKCAVAILHGLEVGLTPMNALQSIAVINGRPSLWGDGALGLIQASGLLEDQDEHFEGDEGKPDFKAVCILKRKGKSRPYVGEFSLEDARIAGLLGKEGPWQGYRKRMMKMRARAFAMRDGFSDVIKGLSVAEEQEDVERARHTPVDDGGGPPVPTEERTEAPGDQKAPQPETIDDGGGPPIPEDEAPMAASTERPTSGFPGDQPIPKDDRHAIPADGGIPEFLRRQAVKEEPVSERSWLSSLDAAFAKCMDLSSLAETQETMMTPRHGKVSAESWAMASDYLDSHIERIQGLEVWDDQEG